MTKKELCKLTAQTALKSTYGFKPALSQITLLEYDFDRTHILFRVGDKEYKFSSWVCGDNGVWVGEDTIRMIAKYKFNHRDGDVRIPITG